MRRKKYFLPIPAIRETLTRSAPGCEYATGAMRVVIVRGS